MRDKKTKERQREKCGIPAGKSSHQGALPGGERIKKKVIDIHFNPQLPTCQTIFTPKTQSYMRQTMKVDSGEQKGEKKDNIRQEKSDGHLILN